MLTTIIVLSLIWLSNCFLFNTPSPFDPDFDLCNDLTLSGGVVSEDGETYIFKGQYYWQIRILVNESGIVGYANLISYKWPEITDKIKLVFTVSKANLLITIFVVKNNWFGYQNGSKTMNGSTENWPNFKNLRVTTAFTPSYGQNFVYVLHSNNNYYVLYDFTNLSAPTILRADRATVRINDLMFTENSTSITGTSLKLLIDVSAGLTYEHKLYFLSKETFCDIDIKGRGHQLLFGSCKPEKISKLLPCPLDLSKRLTTSQSTAKTTPIIVDSMSENSKRTSFDRYSNVQFMTGIPVLGRALVDKDSENKNTSSRLAGGVDTDIEEKNRQNSESWALIILVTVIVFAISAVLIVGGVARHNGKKRPKGKEIFISE